PRREFGIELFQCQRSFRLKPINLLTYRDGIAGISHCAEFFDLGLQFGHRLFEIEIAAHRVRTGMFRSELTWGGPLSQANGLIWLLWMFLASYRPEDAGHGPAF